MSCALQTWRIYKNDCEKIMAKTAKKTGLSKSAFVRGLPANMAAGDVVTKAAAVGIKISPKHVYVIRSLEKKRAAKGQGKAVVGKPTQPAKHGRNGKDKGAVQPAARAPRAGNGHDSDRAFRALVLQVGLVRAKQTLAAIEAAAG